MKNFKLLKGGFTALLIWSMILFGFSSNVFAEDQHTIVNIDSPAYGTVVSGNMDVTGWAISKSGINRVEVALDNPVQGLAASSVSGQATYGIGRSDVGTMYASYPNSSTSGYDFQINTRKLVNGIHSVKVTAYSNDGGQYTCAILINVVNQCTAIIGQSQASKGQMISYLLNNNSTKNYDYANNFVSILMDEASKEGIRADVAFAQIMKETSYLRFTGDVKDGQNNFAGLGATGSGNPGFSFPDMRTGLRAVIQHLKAYASTASLSQSCVDPRYSYVKKGAAPYVEWLGINENPYSVPGSGVGWATGTNYGYDIVNRLNYIKTLKGVSGTASLTGFSVTSDYMQGKNVNISGSGSGINNVLYQFWYKDYSTGKWNLIQDYSDKNEVNWTPYKAGNYRVEMHIKDSSSSNEYDALDFKDITISAADNARVTGFSVPSSGDSGSSMAISGSASSTTKVLYQFWYKDYSTGKWNLIQDYSENSSLNWTPQKPGNYRIEMHVKNLGSSSEYEDLMFKDITVGGVQVQPVAAISSFVTDTNFYKGKYGTIAGTASSPNGVLYQFWVKSYNDNVWHMMQDYSKSYIFKWMPYDTASYRIEMHVKDVNSSNEFDSIAFRDVKVIANGLQGKVIVLDAGHGGSDPGAVNNRLGMTEQSANLSLVNVLYGKLSQMGANVLLTRQDDTYVSLEDRTRIADNNGADLFISIHRDASTNTSATGVSTHYSSYRPEIDNSGTYVSNDITYDSTPSVPAKISADLAGSILNNVASLGFVNRGSSDHNLYVTEHLNMPSVLVEAGFITNDHEARIVTSAPMEDKIASSIAAALAGYYSK